MTTARAARGRLPRAVGALLFGLCALPCLAASAAPVATRTAAPVAASAAPDYGVSAPRSRVDRRVDALSEAALWYVDPVKLADPLRARVAERVAGVRRPLFFVYAGLQIGLLFWLWRSGRSGALRDALARRVRHPALVRIAHIALIATAAEIIGFPVAAIGYRILHDVGVATQDAGAWLADYAVASLLDVAGATFVFAGILSLYARTRVWYVWSAAFVVATSAAFAVVYPLAILPLFHPSEPIAKNSALYAALHARVERAGAGDVPLYLARLSRTTAVGNAMVAGIGPTRRVLVGDTLVRKATPPEVAFVMAHELGHAAHGDAWRLLLVTCALMLFGGTIAVVIADRVPMRRDDDALSRLPLVASVFGACALCLLPIGNAYSRQFEAQADRFALAAGADRTAAARVFVRFADEGFAPICPPRFVRLYFYDHPPLGSRIAAATDRPDPCP